MNTPLLPGDEELERLLAEDSDLLRRYRALPQSEPGKHLDAAILGRASNAVRRNTVRARWLVPVASAASIVAAAGIGWKVLSTQQQEQQAAAVPESKYEVFEIDLQGGDRQRSLDTASMPPQSAAAAAAKPSEPAATAKSADAAAQSRPSLSEIIQGPARDSGIVVDEPHTRTDHAVPGRAPEQRQPISDPYGTGFAGNAAPRAMAPAAPPAPAAEAESEQTLDRMESSGRREQRAKRAADEGLARGQLGALADAEDDLPLYAPADWIELIRDLISARRQQDARSEIVRFRAAYPSYRLPPDLRRYDR